jgi:spore germination protein GerM
MKSSSKDRLLIGAFLVILVVFGAVALRKHFVTPPPATDLPAAVPAPPRPTREVLLYFGAPDASQLLPETRNIEECQVEEECVRATVQALIAGPAADLVPILPSQTTLRGVTLRDGTAELDFSRDLIGAHPGGSISELFTVYGIADTLAVNFPRIRQVRIMVEGAAVETLKGHVGLLEPVKADFTYTRPAESGRSVNTEPEPTTPAAGEKRP